MTLKREYSKVIRERLGVDQRFINLPASLPFIEDLGANSRDSIEVVLALNDEFKIEYSNEPEVGKVTTIQQAIDYVKGKLDKTKKVDNC